MFLNSSNMNNYSYERTYALVIENLLCFPEESKYTLALLTLSPRFFSAFILGIERKQNTYQAKET